MQRNEKLKRRSIERHRYWIACGVCLHGLGFGLKSLKRRFAIDGTPAVVQKALRRVGEYHPEKSVQRNQFSVVESTASKEQRLAWRLIIEHYTKELRASCRHGWAMSDQMVSYYMNHEKSKAQSRQKAKLYYHNRVKLDAALLQKQYKRRRDYGKRNTEKLNDWNKAWRLRNAHRVRGYRWKRSNNPNNRLVGNLRRRVRDYIRGIYKGDCKNLTGLTPDKLKQHIERQFTSGMTWENYGMLWHVDHIVPCAMFDLKTVDGIKKCFHYKNLQPLLAKDNIAKSSKLFSGNGFLPLICRSA